MSFPEPPADDGGAWLDGLPPGRVLVREMDVDRWWQMLPDRTRVLVGGYADAMQLVRSGWTPDGPLPDGSWGSRYVGGPYTVAKVDPVVLDRWADATPYRTFTKEPRPDATP